MPRVIIIFSSPVYCRGQCYYTLVWFLGSHDHDVEVDPPNTYYKEELEKERLFALTFRYPIYGHCRERKEGDSHVCTRTGNDDSTIMFIIF